MAFTIRVVTFPAGGKKSVLTQHERILSCKREFEQDEDHRRPCSAWRAAGQARSPGQAHVICATCGIPVRALPTYRIQTCLMHGLFRCMGASGMRFPCLRRHQGVTRPGTSSTDQTLDEFMRTADLKAAVEGAYFRTMVLLWALN